MCSFDILSLLKCHELGRGGYILRLSLLWLPLFCVPLSLMANEGLNSPEKVLATVNGQPITTAQLEAAARPQLVQLEERARQIRDATLNKLIDNVLIEQAARAQGMSTDEYINRQVESVSVSSGEVDQAYSRNHDQFGGALPAEAKYRIRRTLEDNTRATALQQLLGKLRQEARVSNYVVAGALSALNAAAREGPSVGNPDAPVTLVEFSDFECAFCRAAQAPLRKAMERWPGKVRLVFKHFPLEQHAHAINAAKAGVCADRQGRFWPVHDRIFAIAGSPGADVLRIAGQSAGLNMTDFDRCMASAETADHVRKDAMLGRMAGVAGTPAFFVNGQIVSGVAALEPAIESALKGSQ